MSEIQDRNLRPLWIKCKEERDRLGYALEAMRIERNHLRDLLDRVRVAGFEDHDRCGQEGPWCYYCGKEATAVWEPAFQYVWQHEPDCLWLELASQT